MAFENPDGSFENEWGAPPLRVISPASGSTVGINASDRYILVTGTGTIAALTMTFPMAEKTGHFVEIGFVVGVTSLTLQGSGGQAVVGSATSNGANTSIQYRFVRGTGWVRWR